MNLIKYQELKKKYDEFYESFYNKGQVPVAATGIGLWGAAVTDHLFQFFKEIKLNNYKTFIDLGSGDGKAVLIASLFGIKATGIEFDDDLINHANNFKKQLNIKAEFIKANFLDIGLSKYDIIFINPDKDFDYRFEKKLINELNGRFFVYNFIYSPKILKKGKSFWFDQVPIIEFHKI